MNINWKVRIKNPMFWAQVISAIITPIIVGLGMQWDDMTTWSTLWDAIVKATSNPVIVVSVIVSLWGIINDPTTEGLSDSIQALTYNIPKKDE